MVQITDRHRITTTPPAQCDRKQARRVLLASRYEFLRAFGTVHVPADETRAAIRAVVTATLPRGLARIPFSDTLAEELDSPDADDLPGAAVSRFASADETAPRHMVAAEPVLSPAERNRLRLDVALSRDAEEWTIGHAAPCGWLLVVS